ncbi:R2-like ligand-binding oxidase [Salicibibacter kimchii]|uniref:R2-like ligand binding oxidase n=2 Tax=Salicibibacter kimchii TaxID=2099786 RepID=A0A345C1V3_9BACI|nr:R2-like ligand-binding oxidase [Salicibibacter kimchii]
MTDKPFKTTSAAGIQEDSLPFKLFQKAKRFGVWNPADLDFTQDKKDWETFSEQQKEGTLRLISQFQGGEEAVTRDLLPLIMTISNEGRLEEEMFLTTFLFEEAKHTEFFRIVLNELGIYRDLTEYHSDTYRKIFNDILPSSMERLVHDQSPEAVAEAATVYNMFVEGVLAETGYYGFFRSLQHINAMPALLEGVGNLKRDESRHIAYGTFLLQRIISEHHHIYDLVIKKMEELTPLAIQINQEGMEDDSEEEKRNTMNFTQKQLSTRMQILGRSRDKRLEEIYKQREDEVGMEEADAVK